MAEKLPPGAVAWNVAIPADLAEAIRALAAELGRSAREETIVALRRHLAARPVILYPPVPPDDGRPVEKPQRGRPKKRKAD